jgi:predicted amidohydrolase
MLICFDVSMDHTLFVGLTCQLRFPEASLRLVQSDTPANIITYPSAFTIPTGKAHWSVLLRARAIETQSYVIASAQVGQHNEKRASYGHSMIVSPWGEPLVELGGEWTGPEIGIIELNHGSVLNARRQVPLSRRWDVYGRC